MSDLKCCTHGLRTTAFRTALFSTLPGTAYTTPDSNRRETLSASHPLKSQMQRTHKIGDNSMRQHGASLMKIVVTALFALMCTAIASAQVAGNPQSKAPLSMVLGQPRSVQVARPYGMLTDSVSIVVPPGRRGVEPHLMLNYSSGNGDGVLGVGWDLTIGYVEQDLRNGLPAAVETDTFSFEIAGLGGELYNNGNGVYVSHSELVHRTFEKTSNGGWTMQDGQGNLYTFGSRTASRVGTGLWMLDSVTDPSGNSITYAYLNDEGALYPKTINYTGFGGNTGANQVTFSYGIRPDVTSSWIHGVSETHRLRLTSINASTLVPTQQLARSYQMTYSLTKIGESVLSQISLVGDDNQSTIPLRKMTYTNHAEGWDPAQGAMTLVGNASNGEVAMSDQNGAGLGTQFMDVNGDGCADLNEDGQIWIGDCLGHFSFSQTWYNNSETLHIPAPSVDYEQGVAGGGTTSSTEGQGVQYLDVNGDGLPDIVAANPFLAAQYPNLTGLGHVFLNTSIPGDPSSGGWTEAPNWTLPGAESSYDAEDGQPNCSGATPGTLPFTLNYTGTDSGGNQVNGAPAGVTFADVNGDGLPDIVWSLYQSSGGNPCVSAACSGNVCIAVVYLNTGSGWVKNVALSHELALLARSGIFMINDTWPTGWNVVDINGDGLADLVNMGTAGSQQALLFNGTTWVNDPNYTLALQGTGLTSVNLSDGTPTGLQFFDFSHDGLVDLLYSVQGNSPKAFRNTGTGFQEDTGMETQLASLSPFQGTLGNNKYAQTVAMGDINGDGIIDLIPINSAGYASTYYLGGWCPNSACSTTDQNQNPNGMMLSDGMMQYSVGPLGEEVLVGYNRAPHDLQLPHYVVSWMLRADARDDQQVPYIEGYSWTYSGGLYNDRKFFGFSHVIETDPNGNVMDFTYAQTPIFAGQELTEDIRRPSNSNEFVYQKTNTWTALTGYQGALTSTTETYTDWPDPVLDGGQTSYSTITNFTYDTNLNVTQRYRNPNTTQPGLDSTTVYHWASNSAGGIWSLPASVTEYAGTSTSALAILSSTTFIYDDEPFGLATRGLITSEQEAVQVTVPQKSVVKTNSYDEYGNVVAVKDRNGNTSTYQYDSQTATNRVSATDVDGNTLSSTFDPRFGSALSTTDPSGNTTSYQYDAFGRISKVIKPGDSGLAGGTTNYTYSAITGTFPTGFSVLRRDSMPNQAPMTNTELYDCYGQVYKKLLYNNGKAIVATTLYDTMGYPIEMSRPYIEGTKPVYTTLTRDFLHRITQIQDPVGNITVRSYAGTQVTEIDPRGLTTVTTLNPWEKVISKVLPTSSGTATTQYVYDAEKQLRQVIRADGSTSNITYDLLGRKTSMTDPNTGKYTYQYDNEGHLTAVTGPDGKTIRYTYKPSGSLASRIYPDGTTNTVTYGTAGQTNAVGRMVSVTDAAGTIRFIYDARGRVTKRMRYVAINQKSYVTGYTYDSADHLSTVTYPDGFQAIYTYDDLGNVASVKDGGGNLVAGSFSYSASGRLSSLAYGNGTSSSYTYDVIDRMTSLATKQPGATVIQNLAYSYDADSNISAISDGLNTDNQQFTYDSMNRLVSATGQGYGTEAYSYDALGNLLTKGSTTFVMDAAHPEQADCMIPNTPGLTSCSQGGNTTLPIQYDVHGNMIQVGSSQYAYDPENRLLTESNGGSVTETNIYDFWGDRVVQQTAAETRIFIDGIYEENGTIAERHVRTPNLLLATIVTSLGTTAVKTQVIKHSISTPLRYLVAAAPVGDSRPFMLASTGFSLLVLVLGGCFRVSRSGGRLQVRMSAPKFFKPFRSLLNLLLILCFIVSGGQEGSAEIRPVNALVPPAGAMRTLTVTKTITTKTVPGEVRYYYHMNHLGGVNIVTNDSGAIVVQRQYKPYGEMYQNEGSVATSTLPFSFDGERQDGASSLYYLSARFYNPMLGRFLSADSEIHNPSVPQALNRYAFAGGNPIRYVDPSGHSWWDYLIAACIIIAIVIIAAVSGGAGAALLVVALSAVGFGVGAGIAAGLGYSPTSDSFWQIAVTGALVGAAIGAGVGGVAAEGLDADALADEAGEEGAGEAEGDVGPKSEKPTPSTARSICTDISKSIAFGAPQTVLIHELQGGGTDGLLESTEIGIGESAASGAILGRITSGVSGALLGRGVAGSALTSFGGKLALTLVIQGGLWTFAGLEHQSLPSYIRGQVLQDAPIAASTTGSAVVSVGGDTGDFLKDHVDF